MSKYLLGKATYPHAKYHKQQNIDRKIVNEEI